MAKKRLDLEKEEKEAEIRRKRGQNDKEGEQYRMYICNKSIKRQIWKTSALLGKEIIFFHPDNRLSRNSSEESTFNVFF